MRSAFNYGTSLDSGYYRCPRRTTCIGEAVACLPIADSRIKLKTKVSIFKFTLILLHAKIYRSTYIHLVLVSLFV